MMVDTSDPVMLAAILGSLAAVLMLLFALPEQRNRILAFGIGMSAALVGLQLARFHILTIIVIVWCIFNYRRAFSMSNWIYALVASSTLIASTVIVGSLVSNPQLAVQLLVLAGTACLVALASTPIDRTTMMYGALTLIVLSSMYGVLQVLGFVPTALTHLDVSSLGRPNGFWPEPDWLGMYSAIGIILSFHLRMNRWVRAFVMALCSAMWVLSFARAAWVALAVTLLIVLLLKVFRNLPREAPKEKGKLFAVLVSASAILIPSYFFSQLAVDIVVRLSRTFSAQDDDVSGQARIQQTQGLFHLADTAPWYGNGLSAAGRVGVSGKLYVTDSGSANNVASNWILGLWVDAQFLAIPFIVLIAVLVFLSIRAVQGQVLCVVVISSLFSNATFFPIFWFAIALCLAELTRRNRPQLDDAADEEPIRTTSRSRGGRVFVATSRQSGWNS